MADPKMAEAPANTKKTLVEEGTEFRGSLMSKCPVVVSGKVDGEVAAPSLTVSNSGGVYGKVRVGQIHSEGEIAGEFDAESIELSGKVSNNTLIRTKSLEVKLHTGQGKSPVTFGDCMLEVGEEPIRNTGGSAPAAPKPPAPPKAHPQPPKPEEKPKG